MRAINIEISYDGIFRRTPYVRQGENGTTTLYLVLPTDYQGYKYVIVFQPVTGDPISTVELTPDGNHIISYVLTSVLTAAVGNVGVQLDCYDVDDNLIKSAESEFEVKPSLGGAGDVLPTDYVPWYILTANYGAEAITSAAAAALSETAADEDAAQTALDRIATGADRAQTGLDRIATGEDKASTNSAISTFTNVTLPAAVLEVEGEGDGQILLVQAEGTTQIGLVADQGTTSTGLVTAEGLSQIGLVQAEGTSQTGLVTAEGDTQILLVQGEGTTQIGLVEAEGTTQVGLVEAEGTAQIALVQAQLPNVQANIGELQAEMRNVESTLNQLNPNGDAKITVTSYDTVNSLPKNAAQAGLGVVQEGMTATNLTDGDFSATADWTSTFSTFTVSNGVGSVLADAQNDSLQQALTAIATHKYYIQAMVKLTTGSVEVALRFNDGTNTTDTPTVSSTAWQKVSAIITAGASGAGFVGLVDKRASAWDTIQIKEFRTVNLTAIAKQAATLSQADAMLLDYFSGTQSAVTGRIRSVGKNTFDSAQLLKASGWSFDGTYYFGTLSSFNTAFRAGGTFLPAKFKTATQYTIKLTGRVSAGSTTARIYIKYVGETEVATITVSATTDADYTATSVAGKTIESIMGGFGSGGTSIFYIKNMQIEQGSTATTYESYRKTESYTKPMPLRRVPNNTTDDVTNGKHTKRVSEWANVAGASFDSIDNATYTNVSVVKTTAFSFATAGTTAIDNSIIYRDKNGVVLAEVASADIDNLASIGKFYYHTDKTVWRILAKGSDDIATARTALGTETILYQLLTPVITENVSSGTLLAYPSGTVYWEPVIADVAIYATGASILNTGYPISTLESIYKIDLVTGEQTPLDVASATVASGGLSFTHTGLVDGDLVGFTYYFDHPYPYGENDYTYINSNAVVLGADGIYYKIGFAVDIAGTISLTKTAVT